MDETKNRVTMEVKINIGYLKNVKGTLYVSSNSIQDIIEPNTPKKLERMKALKAGKDYEAELRMLNPKPLITKKKEKK
jgi:hypothetical protein